MNVPSKRYIHAKPTKEDIGAWIATTKNGRKVDCMSKELTDAKRKAIAKYDAANTRQYHMKLNKVRDAEIIQHLDRQPNVQGYLKELIKADLAYERELESAREFAKENEARAEAEVKEMNLTFPGIDGYRDEEACKECKENEHRIIVHWQNGWEVRIDADAKKVLTVVDVLHRGKIKPEDI